MSLRISRRCKEFQIFRLPLHGVVDAVATAGMIEENPFFDGAGAHLAIFAQVDGSLREAVRLAAGIDAVHVGFMLFGSRLRVLDRREDETENREDQQYEREHCNIADASNLPFFSPAFQRPVERPAQQGKSHDDHDENEEHVFVNVMQDVVAHLMSHHGLDFFGRSAAKKIVIERDAHGAAKAADVSAHARGLARSVDFVNVFCRNAVGVSHAEDGLGDLGIVKGRDFVEYGENKNGSDQSGEHRENKSHECGPNMPRARQAADHAKKKHNQYAAQHYTDQKVFELIAHPRTERLRGETVFMFAEVPFINSKRKTQNEGDNQIFRPINQRLERLEAGDAFGKITHARGPAEIQQ